MLDAKGEKTKDVALDEAVFAAEVKPHLVHEAVRSELNAQRAGTFATKSRGLVSGGRAKPWRQKGTGRARAGTIRAAQFTGGGHAFAKAPRTFVQKVNRKAAKAALRSALASHANEGTLALARRADVRRAVDQVGASFLEASGLQSPIVVVRDRGGDERRQVVSATCRASRSSRRRELEVGAVVWARSLAPVRVRTAARRRGGRA